MINILILTCLFAVYHAQTPQLVSRPIAFQDLQTTKTYQYGPSIILENGTYYEFYCTSGDGTPGIWDVIEMSTSKDGLHWTKPTVVLRPNTRYDTNSTCDPAVVKFHGTYFLYHTCINVQNAPDGYKNNRICVAMSDTITGPYYSLPKPVLQDLTCSPNNTNIYCLGQPAAVVVNETVYLYYTLVTPNDTQGPNNGKIFLGKSIDGVHFTLVNPPVQGKYSYSQRDVTVMYDRTTKLFLMAQGDVGDKIISWSASSNGVDFLPYDVTRNIATNPSLPPKGTNNNPGFATLPDGTIGSGTSFVVYGSSYGSGGWGMWHLYRSDVLVEPKMNNCTACVPNSCDYGCSIINKGTYTGLCAYPGSTDRKQCCSCQAWDEGPTCTACTPGSKCVAACRGAKFSVGICGRPGSTDPRNCCTCY